MAEDELIYSARVFRVVRRRYTLADGKAAERECIVHPGAVAVIPITDDGRVCLIRNHRVTVQRTLIEIPAGTLEPPEDPLVCASRELEEETGYTAGKIEKLTTFQMSPGILNERMHLYLATSLHPGPTRLQSGEEIENYLVPWDDALAMVERGEIEDGKTIAALLFADRYRRDTVRAT